MSFKFPRVATAGLAVGVTMFASVALAHDDIGPVPNTPAGKAAAARHENFKQLGGGFKAIIDQVKKDAPDRAVISANAAKVNTLAGQLPSWFPKGSGAESGVKTGAKAEVWSDPQAFAAAAARLKAATGKLQQVSLTGDMAAIKAQVQETGGGCKNCHDKYRVPDKH
jgi:cytochrome c556